MAQETLTAQPAVDPSAVEAFAGKVLGDTTGFAVTLMSSIGDRLGLFRAMAGAGPMTSGELAGRAGVDERYTREWLAAMASAGYVAYDAPAGRFTLPAEHVPALADEGGPAFFGGVQQEFIGFVPTLDRLLDAFRQGGGVPPAAYPEDTWVGVSRFTSGWFNNLLLQQWLPAMPEVVAALERGADVADVGCGYGQALIRLAGEYPRSRFTGYDELAESVARATAAAERAGVADRVRFVQSDAARGLSGEYDVITTFDVLHDSADPAGLLRSIRNALRPDGIHVCLEINCAANLEDNIGPIGALLFSCSVLFCLTMSLSRGGAGLGTMGLHEERLRRLCQEAGFGTVRRVPMDNPFNVLYEIRPTIGAGL